MKRPTTAEILAEVIRGQNRIIDEMDREIGDLSLRLASEQNAVRYLQAYILWTRRDKGRDNRNG